MARPSIQASAICLAIVSCLPLSSDAGDFFKLAVSESGQHHFVTPEGRPFLSLGINHVGVLARELPDGGWERHWTEVLESRFADWNVNTIGYGVPPALHAKLPWFAATALAPIEKHRSDPDAASPAGYHFPDVFDPVWAEDVRKRIEAFARPLRDDPNLIGYFWTDTPTWDLVKTRALRGTDWVSALRALPADAPGRVAYADFLVERYTDRLDELNEFYGLKLAAFDELRAEHLALVPVGRHRVREDDEAFLGLIARRFYDTVGKAQRDADPNHLVFGDRYLAGDAPTAVLEAAAPWIDAVAVQPGDRYTRLYPPSTRFPADEMDHLHATTGKPVMICDHAISYPTAEHPRTIFEQMPDEAAAVAATAEFLEAAFAKPYVVGYLRCQYVDRPAGFGRGLRQGLIDAEGRPRAAMVEAYRRGFADALAKLAELDKDSPP